MATTQLSNEPTTGRAVVDRYFEVIEATVQGAPAPFPLTDIFAEDAIWSFPGDLPFSGTHVGRDRIFADFLAGVAEIFEPELEVKDLVILGEGDTVASEYRVLKRSKTGNDFDTYIVQFFEVRDGLITAVREYADVDYIRRTCF